VVDSAIEGAGPAPRDRRSVDSQKQNEAVAFATASFGEPVDRNGLAAVPPPNSTARIYCVMLSPLAARQRKNYSRHNRSLP